MVAGQRCRGLEPRLPGWPDTVPDSKRNPPLSRGEQSRTASEVGNGGPACPVGRNLACPELRRRERTGRSGAAPSAALTPQKERLRSRAAASADPRTLGRSAGRPPRDQPATNSGVWFQSPFAKPLGMRGTGLGVPRFRGPLVESRPTRVNAELQTGIFNQALSPSAPVEPNCLTTETRGTQSGAAATPGARRCPPRTSRSGPEISWVPGEIKRFPCGQPAAAGAPRTQPRSGKKPLGARGFCRVVVQSGEAATQGARRLRRFTVRTSSRVRPCPHLSRRSGLNAALRIPRATREFRHAGGPRPQRLRTCDNARNSPHPGSDVAAAAAALPPSVHRVSVVLTSVATAWIRLSTTRRTNPGPDARSIWRRAF